VLDVGGEQDVAVEADTLDSHAPEVGSEPAKGLDVDVDDRHGVVAALDAVGKARPHPAAAHDHVVHAHLRR